MTKRIRNPETVNLKAEFRAQKDHVVAVIWFGSSSLGIRFNSPEHILRFMDSLMEQAVKVWPENEWIKEYMDDDDFIPPLPAPPKPSKLL